MTKVTLNGTDLNLALTKDPQQFITGLLRNVLLDEGDLDTVLERQQVIFTKWLYYYNMNFRDTIAKSAENRLSNRFNEVAHNAHVLAALETYRTLPMKMTWRGKQLDRQAVATYIGQLEREVERM